MPDWIHSLLYIVILVTVTALFVFYIGHLLGLIVGVIVGHSVASFIVSKLPGFWSDHNNN
ncbi:MAG: hypothetical protein ACQES4_03610 [Bacillota bacterium]